ncbi:MAG: MAPEG family protein [Gammaproteobacteria bacterium]|nr:MAPEG family protein [Gammaproteobacteria bacterium]
MQIYSLVYPMAALVLLTFFIMYLMLLVRVKAVRLRKISPRYFKLNRGGELPDNVIAISQNYGNLLELPVLFYAVCAIAIMLDQSAEYFVIHAWAFVTTRYIHSYIHTTYNHILHRLYAFALSGFILLSMWVKVVLIVSVMS